MSSVTSLNLIVEKFINTLTFLTDFFGFSWPMFKIENISISNQSNKNGTILKNLLEDFETLKFHEDLEFQV